MLDSLENTASTVYQMFIGKCEIERSKNEIKSRKSEIAKSENETSHRVSHASYSRVNRVFSVYTIFLHDV